MFKEPDLGHVARVLPPLAETGAACFPGWQVGSHTRPDCLLGFCGHVILIGSRLSKRVVLNQLL